MIFARAFSAKTRSPTFYPTLAIVFSTLLWGTWWMPLRALNNVGVGSIWANSAGLSVPLLVLLPLAIKNRRRIWHSDWQQWLGAFLIAAAIALYAEALLRGYVARVLLLFYLTTAWSTLLSRLLLGQAITWQRLLVIVFSLAGAVVIFGVEQGLPYPREMAEWMGLLSGFCWALGLVLLHRGSAHPLSDQIVCLFIFIGPLFLISALLPGGRELNTPSLELLSQAAPWFILLALAWTLPLIALTLYGASRIDPGAVAILLTLEIVVGIVTASLFAGEPFSLREAIGALLIIAAVSSECALSLLNRSPPQNE